MKTLNKIKWSQKAVLILFIGALSIASSFSEGGNEAGHGGDPVEIVYLEAVNQVKEKLSLLRDQMVFVLRIDQEYQDWLLQKRDIQSRLSHLKRLSKALEKENIEFIDGPCIEDGCIERPVTYTGNTYVPKLCVSRSLNQRTTLQEALALIFHELGHGTEEKDHNFLSEFGRQMANPDAASGIKLREDGKKVLVTLTEAQLNPGGYPLQCTDRIRMLWGSSNLFDNASAICDIYGYDGAVAFSTNTDPDAHERVLAWEVYAGKLGDGRFSGDFFIGSLEKAHKWHTCSKIVCSKHMHNNEQ